MATKPTVHILPCPAGTIIKRFEPGQTNPTKEWVSSEPFHHEKPLDHYIVQADKWKVIEASPDGIIAGRK